MRLWKALFIGTGLSLSAALAQTTITIATVNNPDMVTMQKLSGEFEKKYPDIKLNWVVLPENELRQKVTTDIATNAGSYDVLTIGTYETPIWGKNGWLVELSGLPASYDLEDVLKPVRAGLSYQGKLYALPFYAESSMLYYRKDLFAAKKLTVPAQPTWTQAISWAKQLHNPSGGVYGICLRGLPGWGENMAFITTLVNTYGGRWFDENWKPQINSPEWKRAIGQYVELVTKYGPPGVTGNGFTENLTLMSEGKCAMWIDATVAAGYLANPKTSKVADKIGFAKAPVAVTPNGSHWLWSWALAIPKSSKKVDAAKTFITWATSKEYIELVGNTQGWVSAPPGTRYSTYNNPNYQKAAPFAKVVLDSINTADPTKPTLKPVPYTGIQFVGIPEFQAIGTQVGQFIAGIVAGKASLDDGLNQAQAAVEKLMKEAGYLK
ncbi:MULTISPECIES: sugar ABC transporter substrate-binding protein [unclassified Meiothermus]|uniref:ABC transporter substrate-binding protein n=1 Tax=unclassified Meiothermus TaxID=370471 RepID=UPI000D7C04C8|nr:MULTISPECIES: sugar ABC transporter substrate-binding protein [unclassified Meiothermus]PZA06116.1 sugar ABC transporter substrate-binding protein [Meiothermus sp. Pnk-1]RYM35390.1 sugar ABC transporter substrate-binding protein [Meiothermus sp. PNK-Is4]